jgi:hypothetical protein
MSKLIIHLVTYPCYAFRIGRHAHSGWAGDSGPMRKKWRQRRAVVAGQEEEGEGRIEPEGLFYL